ncbi:hypothetical protein [Xylella fastidiosa]|uniref:hypothetical protein n=1 Tax=Xylella fastidiosa TaxID=2371 RepID=UPI0002F7EAC8|nr:hypothetical protein [Xylella fastidiosa]ERI60729.1 hypothetical protein M233_02815 [Xylella fastidiosa subsp. multiplex Griffin-1]MDC6413148.1 hypothetical protein [Xylella fastidiosa subsp. multiplex]MDD0862370.1 hypothetical protein [Xylella fastidiosa subsp. multiplex]MDD0864510.1 hypothetical protein [Xylella fastidiosa subsp. multiplex]MDD0871520.1 hypothetical protein [Xylella fastidiosa subsp. multiplex]
MEMELKQTPRRHTQATALLFTAAPCVVAAAWPIPALPHHPCYSNLQRCPSASLHQTSALRSA